MRYLTLLVVMFLLVRPSEAQGPAPTPKIELKVNGGNGRITASGNIFLPAGWKLSIHTLTVKYQKSGGGGATLNWLIPVYPLIRLSLLSRRNVAAFSSIGTGTAGLPPMSTSCHVTFSSTIGCACGVGSLVCDEFWWQPAIAIPVASTNMPQMALQRNVMMNSLR